MTTTTKIQKSHLVHLTLNGVPKSASPAETVAAVMASDPQQGTRISVVQREARAPFCGMGICQECRVMIDGKRRLACQTLCTEGMVVETESGIRSA